MDTGNTNIALNWKDPTLLAQNGTIPLVGGDPLARFNEEFAQPTGPDPYNLLQGGYPGTVFSFDWGNSHFVSIDTCRYDAEQPGHGMDQVSPEELAWLDADLTAAQSRGVRHIFVMALALP